MLTSFCRRLLLGLLNAGSPARRYWTARQNALVPVFDIINAGPRSRFCTANFVAHNCLGLGFGCGPKKFQVVAKMMAGLDIEPAEAERIVADYRASNPRIVTLWRKLQAALEKSAGANLNVRLPGGRELVYREIKAMYGEFSGLIPRNGKMMRSKLYGGLLAENLTQAFARDIFMDRVSELDRKGYEVLLRIHDEVVCLVDEDKAEDALKDIESTMATTPDWCPDLPVGAEASLTKQYVK